MTNRQPWVPDRIERASQLSARPLWRRRLLLAIGAMLGGAASAQPPASAPMAMPAFAFSTGQSGAVGVTGRIWRVAADGTVSRAPTFNRSEDRVDAQGQLSPAQMGRVAQALADADLPALPPELRLSLRANPAITVLQLGEQRVRLLSPAGQAPTLEAHPDAADEVRRFVRLQTVLRGVLGAALP